MTDEDYGGDAGMLTIGPDTIHITLGVGEIMMVEVASPADETGEELYGIVFRVVPADIAAQKMPSGAPFEPEVSNRIAANYMLPTIIIQGSSPTSLRNLAQAFLRIANAMEADQEKADR